VVGGQQNIGSILNLGSGNSLELVEIEWGGPVGEGSFEVDKGRFCCGDVFDPSLAMVTCTEEEREVRCWIFNHLLQLGNKEGLIQCFQIG
jgi:hypothetical protein